MITPRICSAKLHLFVQQTLELPMTSYGLFRICGGLSGNQRKPFHRRVIIWPKFMGGYEYGVILNSREDDGSGYMFYVETKATRLMRNTGPLRRTIRKLSAN